MLTEAPNPRKREGGERTASHSALYYEYRWRAIYSNTGSAGRTKIVPRIVLCPETISARTLRRGNPQNYVRSLTESYVKPLTEREKADREVRC